MSIEENKRIMDRWLGEVWGKGRTELVLELAGLIYTRHEPEGNRVVRAEDYAKEIATRIEQAGAITEVERGASGRRLLEAAEAGGEGEEDEADGHEADGHGGEGLADTDDLGEQPMPKVPKETRPNSAM